MEAKAHRTRELGSLVFVKTVRRMAGEVVHFFVVERVLGRS
jgi:hypothetical protein